MVELDVALDVHGLLTRFATNGGLNVDQQIAYVQATALIGILQHLTKPLIVADVDGLDLKPGPAQFVRLNPNGHPCLASAIEDGFKTLAEMMRDIPNAIREGNQT